MPQLVSVCYIPLHKHLQYLDAWKIQTRPWLKAELIIHVQGHETSPPRHVIFLRHTIDDPKILENFALKTRYRGVALCVWRAFLVGQAGRAHKKYHA